jgi:hypothetical protein
MSDHLCPVCGYCLGQPAWAKAGASFAICPCCGTQFGLDDAGPGGANERSRTHARLRQRWVEGGLKWWSEATPMPWGWNAREQLRLVERSDTASR